MRVLLMLACCVFSAMIFHVLRSLWQTYKEESALDAKRRHTRRQLDQELCNEVEPSHGERAQRMARVYRTDSPAPWDSFSRQTGGRTE